jgi:K+-sensing histidine kinase KdpD
MTTSVVSAIVLDYFRHWPDIHFAFSLENGVVIIVFLVVALLTNFVAGLARARAVEAEQRHREASALAEQQASLRRVATLVARGVAPSEVFSAVATELAHVLGTQRAVVYRYESDDTATLLASCDDRESSKIPNGTRFPFQGDNINATVYSTGRAARMDSYKSAAGPLAAHLRKLGIRSAVGAPIIVDGRLWGAAIIRSDEPLPPDTEARVGDFTDLAATAIANAEAHAELTASRARIVAAADDARRRIERSTDQRGQTRSSVGGEAARRNPRCPAASVDSRRRDRGSRLTSRVWPHRPDRPGGGTRRHDGDLESPWKWDLTARQDPARNPVIDGRLRTRCPECGLKTEIDSEV